MKNPILDFGSFKIELGTVPSKLYIPEAYGTMGQGDDSAAINLAIAAAEAAGRGTVLLPPDVTIRDTLYVHDPRNITLQGSPTKIIVAVNTVDALYVTGATASTSYRNFHILDTDIYYPVGAGDTTGRALRVSIAATSTLHDSSIERMRIDNGRSGIYIPDSILWFCTFDHIEVTGPKEYGFLLEAPGTSHGNCNNLKHVYINNPTSANPGFKISGCYHVDLDHCAVDHGVKFGEFAVRGLTLRHCGAEDLDLDSLPLYGSALLVTDDESWAADIDQFHFHLAATSGTDERYLIKSTAPLRVKDVHCFGGTAGDETLYSLPTSIYIILATGAYVTTVDGVYYRWAGGGRVAASGGPLHTRNVTSLLYKNEVMGSRETVGDLVDDHVGGTRTNTIRVTTSDDIPTTGTWVRGDIIFSRVVNAGGKVGWSCVTGGTPGTWKPFGVIDA